MKNLKTFLCVMLSCMLLCGAVFETWADTGEVPAVAMSEDAVPAALAETGDLSVSVPGVLAIYVTAKGEVQIGDGQSVTNNGTCIIRVTGITVTGENGWSLIDYSGTPKVGGKEFALRINGIGANGVMDYDGKTLASGESEAFTYEAKISGQSSRLEKARIGTVIYTVEAVMPDVSADWEYTVSGNTVTLTKYIGNGPDVVVHGQYLANGKVVNTALGVSTGGTSGPFSGATNKSSIETITFESGVTLPSNMRSAFEGCPNLRSVSGIGGLETGHVTSMEGLFYNCSNLVSVSDMGEWDTHSVSNATSVFYNCSKLMDIGYLDNWNTSNMTNASMMFYNCKSLTDVGNLANWDTSNLTNTYFMFASTGIKELDLSGWTFDNVPTANLQCMLMSDSLKTVYVGSEAIKELLRNNAGPKADCEIVVLIADASVDWRYTVDDTTNTITLTKYIGESNDVVIKNAYAVDGKIYNKVTLANSGFYMGPYGPISGSQKAANIESITIKNGVIIPNDSMYCMFFGLTSLQSFNSEVDNYNGNMERAFEGCGLLESIDLRWVNSLTNCGSMFADCYSLHTIYVKNDIIKSMLESNASIPSVHEIFVDSSPNAVMDAASFAIDGPGLMEPDLFDSEMDTVIPDTDIPMEELPDGIENDPVYDITDDADIVDGIMDSGSQDGADDAMNPDQEDSDIDNDVTIPSTPDVEPDDDERLEIPMGEEAKESDAIPEVLGTTVPASNPEAGIMAMFVIPTWKPGHV